LADKAGAFKIGVSKTLDFDRNRCFSDFDTGYGFYSLG